MAARENQYQKKRLKQLEGDFSKIESYRYNFKDRLKDDINLRIYVAEEKRNVLVRSLIIEEHLAIEDFINSLLQISLLKKKGRTKKRKTPVQARNYFDSLAYKANGIFYGNTSIGFKRKIILLRVMGAIGKNLYEDLEALNDLRNKCGHTWRIEDVIRRGIKRDKIKRNVLEYKGKNLLNPDSLIDFLEICRKTLLKIAKKY